MQNALPADLSACSDRELKTCLPVLLALLLGQDYRFHDTNLHLKQSFLLVEQRPSAERIGSIRHA